MKKIILISFLTCLMMSQVTFAQESYDDLMDMSIEELMNVEVYSVSKKKESLFESPLSSSIVTREDIMNAGITSIPEALRLMPGLIVREITNGNYDVHIRGLDNLTRYNDGTTSGNQITLVMVDGRPVFNNNTGGIFWESIPVDIVDIQRIEVVRGPSSPLYGPNAVSGVINIITVDPDKEGFSANAIANTGTSDFEKLRTTTAGVNLAYKFNNKLDVSVSANMQNRNRLDEEYFSFFADKYVPVDSLRNSSGNLLTEEQQAYSLALGQKSLEKYGVNAFVNYKVQDDVVLSFQTGYQDASAQRPFSGNSYTVNSNLYLQSAYANAEFTIKNLKGRFSYINGEDNLNSFPITLPAGDSLFSLYTYENIDAYLEYDWQVTDKISLRPGIFYMRSTYSDEILKDEPTRFGVLSGEQTIRTFATSLRGDYQVTDQLRAVLAGRLDYFTGIEDAYLSYQAALAYSINSDNFLRAVVSRSNSGAFMAQTYLNINEDFTLMPFPGIEIDGTFRFSGNLDYELFQLQLFEVGYRSKILPNLDLDLELFHQRSENSNAFVNQERPEGYFPDAAIVSKIENLAIEARQYGATMSVNYIPMHSLKIRPFITVQTTNSVGFPSAFNSPERNPDENITITEEVDNPQTPTAFGGFTVNYQPSSKWNLNLNSYYMSAHTQFSDYDPDNRFTTAGEIDNNFILNMVVNYSVTDNLNVYLNGRNLLDNNSKEFYGADRKSFMILGGISLDL